VKIRTILKRLYTISVLDEYDNPVEWDQSKPIPYNSEDYREDWYYECNIDYGILECNKIKITRDIVNVFINNEDEFDEIVIEFNKDTDGYSQYPVIVGYRSETNEEIMQRLREEEPARRQKQKQKQEKKEQKQRDLALLKKLKEKYEQ